MKSPLVSVVIPTHNRPKLLKVALESVLSQIYDNLEIVVVDDASNKETKDFLQHFQEKEKRLRVVRNEKNKGFVCSLNVGIRGARGEYIARIDDDDVWIDREKIKQQITFFQAHPEYVLVGGGIIRVDERGKEISRQLLPETDEHIRKIMLLADPFVHVSVIFRKRDWENVGGYDERFDYAQDWELWMKLGKYGKYRNLQDYVVRSVFSSDGRSSKNMRHHLWLNLLARKLHGNEFPHFWKGYVLGWISYLFSFIPIRVRVSPWVLKIRELIVR